MGRLYNPRRVCGQWLARVLLQQPGRNHGKGGRCYEIRIRSMLLPAVKMALSRRV